MKTLSPRELDVLECLADGYTIEETCEALKVSSGTVNSHRIAVYQKLRAKNAPNAISLAYRQGILRVNGKVK